MGIGFEEFIVKLSCYDFRLDDLGLAPATRYRYIETIKKSSSLRSFHLKHLKPMGIGVVYGVKRVDPGLWRRLHRLRTVSNEFLEKQGFPLPWYIHTISLLNSKQLFISWFIPPGIDPGSSVEWLDEGYYGWKIPVQNCLGRREPKLVNKLGKHLHELVSIEKLELRTPVLAHVLIAVLDHDPLLTLKKIGDIVNIAASRDLPAPLQGSIKPKYINRYYRRLSEAYVLGRVYVSSGLSGVKALIGTDKRCTDTLYGALAATGESTYLYYSKLGAMAGVTMSGILSDILIQEGCDLDIYVRYRTMVFPFPYELYDPFEDKWHTRPRLEYALLLKKLGLIHVRE